MQAVAVNQRREQFRDARVRRAIALCFDFEWTQRKLFYGSYERSQSCVRDAPTTRPRACPSPEELALLEPLRGKLPPEAFGEAVMQPVSDGSGRDRKLLGEAHEAARRGRLEAARRRSLATTRARRLTVEILVDDECFVRIDSPWVENMRAIGIDASIRMVDSAQYQARTGRFRFRPDVDGAVRFRPTPTRDELEGIFHSRAASAAGLAATCPAPRTRPSTR